ncbi:MAG: DinB family protein [Candidatus Heimdallarchaeota archaeon]|nr:DinB family protein [Candidatus Heimdallarchaeota archaeon]MBY8993728.1 DinB family protein [Candidatus Heimdallarchaeota archaeon]
MSSVATYIKLWHYFKKIGYKTIEKIESNKAWNFRLESKEFTVKETFYHTLRAIFEDAGNWFLKESLKFTPTNIPTADLERAVNRMINAIKTLNDSQLADEFTFPWGEKSTIEEALMQNLYHAIGHFAQLRERCGIKSRTKK